MKVLKKESDKLIASKHELNRRRSYWESIGQAEVEKYFNEIIEKAKNVDYPFYLNCNKNNETANENIIQLSSAANKTGVIHRIDTPTTKGATCEAEDGSGLVISLSSSGHIHITIYPIIPAPMSLSHSPEIEYIELISLRLFLISIIFIHITLA